MSLEPFAPDPDDRAALAAAVLTWGDAGRRELPWRRTRDPWAILVSELMLQQTQVARVLPKYEAFLARFPTPTDCARGAVGDVIDAWAGLGYNRRAVNLHRAAVAIFEHHGGVVPDSLDELLALPGIGPYTARAVLAFAYEADVGVVDVNAGRVLARWAGQQLTAARAQGLADALVPAGASWRWNQTMLDLGATLCRAHSVTCGRCPARPWCAWRGTGDDPAVGSSATTSRQSRFEGSDRQGRGRLVAALRSGPVLDHAVAEVMGWPDDLDRARRVAATLVTDGLAVVEGGRWRLPRRPPD